MQLEERRSLHGHRGQVWSVAWNPKPCNHAQHMLASTGDDATAIVWHCIDHNWEKFQVLDDVEKRSLRSCDWHPEGATLAAGGCGTKINLWRYDEGTKAFSLIGNIPQFQGERVKDISWNTDGSLLLWCSNRGQISISKESKDGYVTVCRVSLEENAPLSCARWHPSGNKFVVAGSQDIKTFELYQNDQGLLEARACHDYTSFNRTYHDGAIYDVSFISDEQMVSAGADQELKFWWLESSTRKRALRSGGSTKKRYTWNLAMTFKGHGREILCIDCSWSQGTFGYLIASACEERDILLHFVDGKSNVSGYKACVVACKDEAHKSSIKDLKWHCKDPNILASVGSDGLVKIWEVARE